MIVLYTESVDYFGYLLILSNSWTIIYTIANFALYVHEKVVNNIHIWNCHNKGFSFWVIKSLTLFRAFEYFTSRTTCINKYEFPSLKLTYIVSTPFLKSFYPYSNLYIQGVLRIFHPKTKL